MKIWAVCTYFNYFNYENRLNNYKIFRKNLKIQGIDLLTVEFNPWGNFQLTANDAEKLIQLQDGDLMWQKERLLNIGIESLDEDTDIVLILDADIVFDNNSVKYQIEKIMDTSINCVQMFATLNRMNPFCGVDYLNMDYLNIDHKNTDLFLNTPLPSSILAYTVAGNFQQGASGYAWAFKYKNLIQCKLFEYNIIGGGDRISASAFIGLPVAPPICAGVNFNCYIEYLQKVLQAGINRNTVTFMNVGIYDLFHGFHYTRKYAERHGLLKQTGFDYSKHLIVGDGTRPLKFSNDAPDKLKSCIYNYMKDREK